MKRALINVQVLNFKTAVNFLTLFPFCPRFENRGEGGALHHAAPYFPVVGYLIAGITWAVYAACQPVFSRDLNALVLVFLPLILSGGLHADGFADFCDGFFGGRSREETLQIMKDPHLGAWGVLGLVFLILSKFVLLKDIHSNVAALVGSVTLSRWAMVAVSYGMPYGGNAGGLAAGFAGKITKSGMFWTTAAGWPVTAFWGVSGILVLLAVCFVAALLRIVFEKKVGGVTGDMIGAAGEITELTVLLGILVLERMG
ncbi:MAG: cobalamin 5'-phosphate synthase [Omnitrophica bacterium GWA2_52_8]|nr:MAG: cobalamin 5'-phosphate synthase [Omnitrophica bacterium GWA2_52_8]